MSTAYEDLGGEPVLEEVVNRFYGKVLADMRLSGFFTGTDMARLRRRQVELFTAALGGPGSYWWDVIKQVHEGRGIYHEDFDLVIGHLADSLREVEVPESMLSGILFAIAPLARDHISVAPSAA